jgi:adenine-specific DNA-methyltransferase
VEAKLLWWGKDGRATFPRLKIFPKTEKAGLVPLDIWKHEDTGTTDEGGQEVKAIFGYAAFTNPKPTRLIERILRLATGPDDIVLDFFAGSGTTAHAVHKLNAADGGKRRCILVSSTEANAEEPEKNLCRDVCAVRVRRAIEGYTTGDGEKVAGLGGDFAYLRTKRIPADRLLDMSHEEIWTALQLAHRDSLAQYKDAPFLWAGDADSAICYVPRFKPSMVAALRAKVKESAVVTMYSWQPQVLKQHIRAGCVEHAHVSETLTRWFGFKLGAGG